MTFEDISDGVHLVPLDDDDIKILLSGLYWLELEGGRDPEIDELVERLKELTDAQSE